MEELVCFSPTRCGRAEILIAPQSCIRLISKQTELLLLVFESAFKDKKTKDFAFIYSFLLKSHYLEGHVDSKRN